jgi:spermidine synthase
VGTSTIEPALPVASDRTAPAREAGRPASRLAGMAFFTAVAVFFFLSGASGLIYQVAWVRILGLIFGVTVHAVSTVLAGFMAGLALGSYLAGRTAGRIRHPLRAYGLVECGIGLCGLLTPRAFAALRDAYPAINRAVEAQAATWAAGGPSGLGGDLLGGIASWLPSLVRWALAFGVLMVPTTLMGATLPVMLKSSLTQGSSLGRSVSLLYAVNTFGAIAGTAGAGFYLIAHYGVQASIHLAAALNLGVGLVAVALSFVIDAGGAGEARKTTDESAAGDRASSVVRSSSIVRQGAARALRQSPRQAVVYLAFAVSGLCGLGYEVIWFRLLSLFAFDNSTYAFTAMLAMVLLGIAAGSYALGPFMGRAGRRINWWIVFVLLEWGIGMLAIVSVTVLSHADAVIRWLVARWPALAPLTQRDDGWVALAAFVAIVPAMFLSGMTFPVAAMLFASEGEDASRRVGSLYAANVLGAIAGSLLAGFVLMPALASQRSLLLLAGASALAGAAVLWAAPAPRPKRRQGWRVPPWSGKAALTVVGTAGFALATQLTPDMYAPLQQARFPGKEVVWYREGLESTVTVVRDQQGLITLYTNARGQARDEVPLVTFHRLLGHLPLLLHPQPRRALIVGIGGGATAGAMTQHPGVEIDAVELSDAVIDAVRLFGHVNYRFFEHPNVHIRQADARNHLLISGRRYDVVSGDAIRPNDAGSATLYSAEYYRLVLQSLEDGGLMTQWIPPFSDYEYRLVIRTFLSVFPYATLWQDGDVLIGSNRPIRVDRAALARRFEHPQVRAALAAVGIPSADEFLRRFNAAEDELRRMVGDGPIITDDRPYIEFFRTLPRDHPPDMARYSRDVRQILR